MGGIPARKAVRRSGENPKSTEKASAYDLMPGLTDGGHAVVGVVTQLPCPTPSLACRRSGASCQCRWRFAVYRGKLRVLSACTHRLYLGQGCCTRGRTVGLNVPCREVMLSQWVRIIAACLLLASGSVVYAVAPPQSLGEGMLWFEDSDEAFADLDQLLAADAPPAWQVSDTPALNAGFAGKPYWFRFELEPAGPGGEQRRYLQIPEPLFNRLDIYLLQGGEEVGRFRLGADFPFRERLIAHRDFVVPLLLDEQLGTVVYARVRTGGSLQFAPLVWRPDAFAESTRMGALISGLFYGVMLAMLIYNLFILLVVRDRVYFYYICVVAVVIAFLSSLQGDAYQFIWPNLPRWNETSVAFFVALLSVPTIAFARSFLKLPTLMPRISRLLEVQLAVAVVVVALTLVLEYRLAIRIASLLGLVVMATMLITGIWMWLSGHRHARYFVLAWVALLLGTSALALSKWGLLPWNVVTANGSQIGAVAEVLLLSFALADRIRQERAKRFAAQEESLHAMLAAQVAQEELLEAREASNRELESRVSERTRELQEALAELGRVNSYLEGVSNTDQLTELYNRHYFVSRYHEEYRRAHRQQQPVSIILMDIDHFKDYNDNHGHLAGDVCLKAVAETFRQTVCRAGDTVARYGGEEFIVLLSDTSGEGAMILAERLRAAVAETEVIFEGQHLPVTISLGVASVVPHTVDNPELLIQWADKALYKAKEQGRNKVCSWRALAISE